MDCKVVVRVVLQAVFHEGEVVHAHDAVALKQLCLLLLVLADHKLLIVEITSVSLHHARDLVAMTVVLHNQVERVCC